MWLLPVLSAVASVAVRAFYRLRVAGERVPPTGPVLLVANHPNSLLDPAVVAAVAGRSVRFLAKAPLFDDRQVGWLVRAAGAIPVFRRADDETLLARNEDTFRAAHQALLRGDAVGIFPEGISHSEPALAPLRTGAARIALGAAALHGAPIAVVPLGLTFRAKGVFRSEALAVVGRPIAWDDIAAVGDEPAAVRALTRRIEAALREVTVNLERWDDAALVEGAESILAAERGMDRDPALRLSRAAEAADLLARLRSADDREGLELARAVEHHLLVLRRSRLRPDQLASPAPLEVARWTARNLVVLLATPLAIVGAVAFWLPYQLTGALERASDRPVDVRGTYKLLVGGALHVAWWLLLALAALVWRGPWLAALALLLLPAAGAAAIVVWDLVRRADGEANRFVTRSLRGDWLDELRGEQRALAERLHELRERLRESS